MTFFSISWPIFLRECILKFTEVTFHLALIKHKKAYFKYDQKPEAFLCLAKVMLLFEHSVYSNLTLHFNWES